MKRLASLPLVALLLGAAPATAQTTFHLGLRGGLNRALTTLDPASTGSNLPAYAYSTSKSAIYAWQAGVVLEANFGKLAFQPALLFSQKGDKFELSSYEGDLIGYFSETTSTNHTNWLELPLNVVYTQHHDHGLQLFAGPYVALALGGRHYGTTVASTYGAPQQHPKYTDFDDQTNYGPGTNNRRLDMGVNFGVGYRQGPVQLQLGFGLGLRNLHQDTNDVFYDYGRNFNGDAAYNRVAQLTGTYFFAL